MPFTLTVPNDYGYVLLVGVATGVLSVVHMELTAVLRKAAKVPYPNGYATAVETSTSVDKYRFNCAQRAHAHYVEHLPNFLVTLFVAGLKYPQSAAALGAAWCVARLMFAFGYTRRSAPEKGAGRYVGSWWVAPHFALMIMAGMAAWGLVGGP